MNKPSFFEGVGIALVASLVAGVLGAVLCTVIGSGDALRLVVALIGLAYIVYLLRRAPERCGRVIAVALWCAVAAVSAIFQLPLSFFLLIHLGLIWLIRSLYFHSSLLVALADLGVVALGFAAALWALMHAGSWFLAFWCFFLVQALFVLLPADLKRRTVSPGASSDDFEYAHRAAEAALRRLSSTR
jgi:hypothetical protein